MNCPRRWPPIPESNDDSNELTLGGDTWKEDYTCSYCGGLNPDKVEKITDFCRNKINISFGIGTDFTNDVGVEPLNIVIKMVEAKPEGQEWTPTIKLSALAWKELFAVPPMLTAPALKSA